MHPAMVMSEPQLDATRAADPAGSSVVVEQGNKAENSNYNSWTYSPQGIGHFGAATDISPLPAPAPPFSLPAPLPGRTGNSAALLALGPLVVNFFPGRWCPYCVTEREPWRELQPELRRRGALSLAISPQPPRQNDFTLQQH